MAPSAAIAARDWSNIQQLAEEAVELGAPR
jgi:hypothetical protein